MTRIGLLMPLLALFGAPGEARADCVSACQASTYCDSEMHASGECGRLLNDCYINECSRTRYGAIAYGAESKAYGWSNDLDDGPSAERQALANCQESGDDCQVVVNFWNTCAAVATAGDHFAYGLGDTRGQAEEAAIAECTKDGVDSCAIQVWACATQ